MCLKVDKYNHPNGSSATRHQTPSKSSQKFSENLTINTTFFILTMYSFTFVFFFFFLVLLLYIFSKMGIFLIEISWI